MGAEALHSETRTQYAVARGDLFDKKLQTT